MIVLENVTKHYVSKDRKECIALNNVSLTFPSQGLISIVGRSGSGKSTLLKMLGCILTPSNGNIFYQNININTLTDEEKNMLRSNYFGFIFQEFHLIDKLTVFENIKLALDVQNISEDDCEKKISQSLEKLDILHLKDGNIFELSNGERQRVAIARVIAKGCKVIFADEPTGSLDDENAEAVYDILKTLSKSLLVILVTHEKDAAYQYSDRVITLKSGNIYEDKILNKTNENFSVERPNLQKKSLSMYKMFNWSNKILRRRLKKFVFTIFFWTFCFSFLLISLNLLFINKVEISTRVLTDNYIQQFKITKKSFNPDVNDLKEVNFEDIKAIKGISYHEYYSSDLFIMETVSFMKHKSDPILNYFYQGSLFNYIEIIDNGELAGIKDIKLEQGEIFISDYQASKLIFYGVYDITDIADCIGKKIIMYNGEYEFIIKGIYTTDYQIYLKDEYTKPVETGLPKFFYDRYFNSKSKNEYSTIFMTKETFLSMNRESNNSFKTNINNYVVNANSKDRFQEIGGDGYIGQLPTEDNEIIVSLPFLSAVLNQDIPDANPDSLKLFLGRLFSLEISNEQTKEIKDYKITGIAYSVGTDVFYSNQELNRLFKIYSKVEINNKKFTKGIVARLDSVENLNQFMKMLLEKDYFHYTFVSFDALWAIEFIESTSELYMIISMIALIILIMMIYFFTTTLIIDNKKTIGVVTSLGYSKKEAITIFVFENAKMYLLSYLSSIVILVLMIVYLNQYIIKNSSIMFQLVKFNPVIVLTVGLATLLVTFVCSMLSIIHLARKDLVDLIYDA